MWMTMVLTMVTPLIINDDDDADGD